MKFGAIIAIASNGVIGSNGRLPWSLPSDLRMFRWFTDDQLVVVGRKTWDNLPSPLPRRRVLVLTRDREYITSGATVVHSVDDVLAYLEEHPEEKDALIIGGSEVYRLFWPMLSFVRVTHVHASPKGDTHFELNLDGFECVDAQHFDDEDEEFTFTIEHFERVRQ